MTLALSLFALVAFLHSTFYQRLRRQIWGLASLTLAWIAAAFLPYSRATPAAIPLVTVVYAFEGRRV